jgi:pimeloyl-ACP methyl ester carboxylesterase
MHHPVSFCKANATLRLYPIVGTPTLTHEAFFSAHMPQEQVKGYFARIQDESYLAFLDMMAFALPHPARVTSPLLVLGGQYDTIFNRQEVEATARAYHTQATFFPVAHDMMLEDTWQDIADYMLAWLQTRDL